MSQTNNTITKRPHRTRVQRNRPVLVSGSSDEASTVVEEQIPTTEDLALDVPQAEAATSKPALAKRISRLPGFFSKVSRNEQEEVEAPSQEEIVEARMARAKKGDKNQNSDGDEVKAETKTAAKPAAKAQAPAKPKLFKTRHFIGLMAYLLVAQVALPEERALAISMKIEKVLFTIPGINLPVQTSFLLNIITLIVLLYILVALDFLPSGKQFGAQQAKYKNNAKQGTASSQPGARQIPPAVRTGVQGEADDLYKNYRLNQRKKK